MVFEELEHTADIRMRITAPDLSSLFAESGFALARTLYGDYPRETPAVSFSLQADGKDPEELIVNFLSELLFLTETEYLVPQKFTLTVGPSVSGTVQGVLFDRQKHAGGTGVKGISYSGLSLTKTETGYELIIIFDI
ncbi:MAG: archease [Methanocorpusculum sp.]|jgi:SHS2 domain-containing protein|uniref:Archease domain-containing protein n=1 Tax=Methanocorpusculum parvum TaxID=2193 RepID=A0AAX0Q6B6_9EURY|nr:MULTISPECIES: archease [Methanocorpusculum]MDD2249202.1 archease [Methanocorpusculum sp.]MDD2803632.1 archease [Methanocorpusculum sp.]MDD3047714.1 archease [Methanocorpusculum sp.]MDD3912725.1 archease [Methanocorpusculum sp.]MDD4424015.1 archease [Methanocorpusculum parvum]